MNKNGNKKEEGKMSEEMQTNSNQSSISGTS